MQLVANAAPRGQTRTRYWRARVGEGLAIPIAGYRLGIGGPESSQPWNDRTPPIQ
jgi:hypothetical protein